MDDDIPKSMKDARAQGVRRYFTGRPCKHGHVSTRVLPSGNCEECLRIYHDELRQRPDQKARAKAASRRSYLRNRDKVLAKSRARAATGYNRRYYEANKDKFIANVKAWIKANPQRRAAYRNNRRSAHGKVSADEIENIRKMQRGKCAVCRVPLKGSGEHIDHITPLARGGENVRSNIQLLCPTCNRRKGAKDPIDFMQHVGRLL